MDAPKRWIPSEALLSVTGCPSRILTFVAKLKPWINADLSISDDDRATWHTDHKRLVMLAMTHYSLHDSGKIVVGSKLSAADESANAHSLSHALDQEVNAMTNEPMKVYAKIITNEIVRRAQKFKSTTASVSADTDFEGNIVGEIDPFAFHRLYALSDKAPDGIAQCGLAWDDDRWPYSGLVANMAPFAMKNTAEFFTKEASRSPGAEPLNLQPGETKVATFYANLEWFRYSPWRMGPRGWERGST